MKQVGFLAMLTMCLLIGQSCKTRWTEAERQAFAAQCEQTDSVQGLGLSLVGFTYPEVASVLVHEVSGNTIVDSFYAETDNGSFDSIRTTYYARINRTLYLGHHYMFYIQGQKPYILSGMKMMMWAQWTMMSEGYGCVMGEYVLNGKTHEHDSGITLMKKGFKYPWQ